MIFIAVYVDDVLYFTNSISLKTDLKSILTKNFKMKDLGIAEYRVGLHISRDKAKGIVYLDQSKYIAQVLAKFGMIDNKPIDTPADPNQR